MIRVTVKVELTESQAMALAQFAKRVGFSEFTRSSVSDEEAYEMVAAMSRLREELAEVGYSPR